MIFSGDRLVWTAILLSTALIASCTKPPSDSAQKGPDITEPAGDDDGEIELVCDGHKAGSAVDYCVSKAESQRKTAIKRALHSFGYDKSRWSDYFITRPSFRARFRLDDGEIACLVRELCKKREIEP